MQGVIEVAENFENEAAKRENEIFKWKQEYQGMCQKYDELVNRSNQGQADKSLVSVNNGNYNSNI